MTFKMIINHWTGVTAGR